MPLTLSPQGKEVVIQKISGKEEIKRHLEELGFTAGSKVTVVSEMGGNMILNVKGSRIALGKDLCMKIAV